MADVFFPSYSISFFYVVDEYVYRNEFESYTHVLGLAKATHKRQRSDRINSMLAPFRRIKFLLTRTHERSRNSNGYTINIIFLFLPHEIEKKKKNKTKQQHCSIGYCVMVGAWRWTFTSINRGSVAPQGRRHIKKMCFVDYSVGSRNASTSTKSNNKRNMQ